MTWTHHWCRRDQLRRLCQRIERLLARAYIRDDANLIAQLDERMPELYGEASKLATHLYNDGALSKTAYEAVTKWPHKRPSEALPSGRWDYYPAAMCIDYMGNPRTGELAPADESPEDWSKRHYGKGGFCGAVYGEGGKGWPVK